MLLKVAIILLAVTFGSCFRIQINATIPLSGASELVPEDALTRAGLFQGDIMLQPDGSSGKTGKNGILDLNARWGPKNHLGYIDVPILFDGHSQDEQNTIINALVDMYQFSCIRFVYSNGQGDYVRITNQRSGCWSYVGRIGGRQDLNVESPGCLGKSVIQHEMLHALGFYHMQSSSDRDNYVIINYQNIQPGAEGNFDTVPSSRYGTPYDFESGMHYNSHTFSRNGQPTIVPRDSNLNPSILGRQGGMTEGDKQRLRNLYQC